MERDKEEVKISIRQNILNEFTEEGKEPPLFEDIIPELREPYASMTSEGEILEYIFQEELADLRANDCFSDTDNWSIDSTDEMGYSNRNLTIGYTLRDGNILPPLAQFDEDNNWCGVNPAGVQAVKEELYAGRGVSISIYADQSRPDENNQAEYLNQNTWSQYTCTEKDTNHRVSIIGWDDTYSRNKFNNGTTPDGEDRTPPGDGAWIIKNSWGSEDEGSWIRTENGSVIGNNPWGIVDGNGKHTGCFFLSYYDKSLYSSPESLNFDNDLSGYAFYPHQYDYMPAYSGSYKDSSSSVIATANVFTTATDELLTSVSTCTASPDSLVTFALYQLDQDAKSPDDGQTLVDFFSVEVPYAGYHRIDLPYPVALEEGTRFSVVSCVMSAEKQYQFAANAGLDKTASDQENDTIYCVSKVNPGESWLYKNDQWNDWSEILEKDEYVRKACEGYAIDNFSIKAFGVPWNDPDIENAVLDGNSGTVEASFSSGDGAATALCAVYTEDGQMLNTAFTSFVGTKPISFQFEDDGIGFVRLFLLNRHIPIGKSVRADALEAD